MRYGLPVSASLHAIALVAALVVLPGGEPLVVQEQSLPVDLMTPQEFAQISKGDKTAKPQDKPKPQADKQEPPKPTPDNPSQQVAKHDATDPQQPPPQPQPKPPEIDQAAAEAKAEALRQEEAAKHEAARQAAAAAQQKAALEKAQQQAAQEQAAKDQAAKDEARKLADLAQQAAAEEAKQKAEARARKLAEDKAAAEKAAQDKALAEKVAAQKAAQAKALAEKALAEKAAADKAAAEKATQQHLASVEDLLNKDKPARMARSAEDVSPTASLGKQDATAPKLSISERSAIQGAIIDHVTPCWNKPSYAADPKALSVLIDVDFNPDGTLAIDPQITRYPAAAGGAAAASAALRALKRCITTENPVKLPPNLYSGWQHVEVNFNPGG